MFVLIYIYIYISFYTAITLSHLSWEKLRFCIRLKRSTHIYNRNSAQQLVLLIAFECFWGMRVQKAKLPPRPSQEGRPDAFRQSISTVVPSSPAIPATRDPWILKMEVYSLWTKTEKRIRFDMDWFRQKHLKLRLDMTWWIAILMKMTWPWSSPIHLTKGSRMRSSRLRFADSSPERQRGSVSMVCWKVAERAAKKKFQLSNFFDSITEDVFVFE